MSENVLNFMKVQEIKSRVLKTEPIFWKELEFIQDETFKEWIGDGDEKLVNSLLKYQFVDPFKVWEHEGKIYCLDGKHRTLDLKKLIKLGVDVPDKLPATFMDCESMTEAAELVLIYSSAYARITQQGLFDFVNKFNLDIPTLREQISIPDFSMERFEQKFDLFDVESAEEDEVYVADQDCIVKEGDIFELNGHRILCGSFKDKEKVEELMGGDKARIVNCDPPYNLPANFFTNKESKRHKDFQEAAGEMSDEEFVQFLMLVMEMSVIHTVPGSLHFIFMDFRHSWHMTEAARRVYGNPQPKQVCVWTKDRFANGSFYRPQHELCFIFSDEKAKALWNNDLLDEGGEFYKDNNEWCFIFKNGDAAKHLSHLEMKDRIRSNVWNYPGINSKANPDRFELKNHPTPKSSQMISDSILDTTNYGDLFIDWFLGSGTALISAEHTGRKGRFTELEPVFVQGSIIRFINYCEKRGININFEHSNGDLTLNDFLHERSKLSNSN